jgi:transposase InsO family protein
MVMVGPSAVHLQRLWSVHARTRGRSRQPGPPVHDELVRREFTAAAPDRLWLTDITEHPTTEGKLYLCAVKDACSKRIVGYSMNERMTSQLAVDALGNAVALRGPVTAIVHSDRGSPGIPLACLPARLARRRPTRLDGPGRNLRRQHGDGVVLQPAAEEIPETSALAYGEQLRLAIIVWIETTYYRRRRQDALGRLTPVECETLHQAAHAA